MVELFELIKNNMLEFIAAIGGIAGVLGLAIYFAKTVINRKSIVKACLTAIKEAGQDSLIALNNGSQNITNTVNEMKDLIYMKSEETINDVKKRLENDYNNYKAELEKEYQEQNGKTLELLKSAEQVIEEQVEMQVEATNSLSNLVKNMAKNVNSVAVKNGITTTIANDINEIDKTIVKNNTKSNELKSAINTLKQKLEVSHESKA